MPGLSNEEIEALQELLEGRTSMMPGDGGLGTVIHVAADG
jgi:hypothetical protein